MTFQNFIKALQAIEGLESLTADQEGIYSLRINHLYLVSFSESFSKEEIFLYSSLCQIPTNEEQKTILFDRLLTANLFGKDAGNGWFAKDPHFNQILLINRISIHDLSQATFLAELQKLISCLSYWKKNLQDTSFFPSKNPLTSENTSFFLKI